MSYGDSDRNIRGANGPNVSAPIQAMDQREYTEAFQAILHGLYGRERFAIQTIADLAGVNDRTAKNWWEGRCLPGAFQMERLRRGDPRIDAELRRLWGDDPDTDLAFEAELMRLKRNLSRLWEERRRR